MKFEINFANPDTGEQRKITVQLNEEEAESVRAMEDRRDLYAQAYALHHAYREVPKGFLHIQGQIRPVYVN